LELPSRARWREIFLAPPAGRTLACVAESGQIWIHFKARISPGGYPFRVMFERRPVSVPRDFMRLLAPIEELYTTFSKKEIQTAGYSSHRIIEFGAHRWNQLDMAIAPYRGSRIFDLALFVAQKEE